MIVNGDCKYTTADGRWVDYSSEITAESAKYKFGGDKMAEYLYGVGDANKQTGSVEWDVYVQLYGKRILLTDDRGFAWVQKYATPTEASEAYDAIANAYCEWLDENED